LFPATPLKIGIFVVIKEGYHTLKRHAMNRQLPIGIHDFETIRIENHVYVDKTQFLYQMITRGAMYFLSRPRRFGKSLLISTLKSIFQGKRHLFKGLWINQSDYAWEQHPIIWLDMSAVTNSSAEEFQRSLNFHLDKIAKQYGIKLPPSLSASVSDRLDELITELAQQNNQKVVVLIDEYDSPLIDQIHRPELALENREILKKFYGILKVQNANLRFVLLTGVSKFSKVSVFSGLNNLEDISLSNNYATLLGYTQQEIMDYFSPEIAHLAQKEGLSHPALLNEIKHWYNGYRFSEEEVSVYNPFSTLLLFKQQKFSAHWFATGTPTFLVNLIQEQQFDIANIENLKIREADLSVFEIDKLGVLPLLYQTGYLTIKSHDRESGHYELGYPNREVEMAFLESLLARFSKVAEPVQSSFIFDMVAALKKQAFNTFFQLLKGFLASIPYELHIPGEKYYQNIFYFVFNLVGLRLNAEVRTNRGKIDAVIEGKAWIYIFELKVDKSAQEALEQIKTKGYADPYKLQQKAIYLIGINFNSAERNVGGFVAEQLA
jgi:hypothetical protein